MPKRNQRGPTASNGAARGPGCVKTKKNSERGKNDLSERSPRDFLGAGNGHPTHEYFEFLRFYTASAINGHSQNYSEVFAFNLIAPLAAWVKILKIKSREHGRIARDTFELLIGYT